MFRQGRLSQARRSRPNFIRSPSCVTPNTDTRALRTGRERQHPRRRLASGPRDRRAAGFRRGCRKNPPASSLDPSYGWARKTAISFVAGGPFAATPSPTCALGRTSASVSHRFGDGFTRQPPTQGAPTSRQLGSTDAERRAASPRPAGGVSAAVRSSIATAPCRALSWLLRLALRGSGRRRRRRASSRSCRRAAEADQATRAPASR
jgi:hypothetical protein